MKRIEKLRQANSKELAKYLSEIPNTCPFCTQDEKEECDEDCERHIAEFLEEEDPTFLCECKNPQYIAGKTH